METNKYKQRQISVLVIQSQAPLQPKEISEVHVRNAKYKGKNYDPNFQAKHTETNQAAS